MTIESIPLTSVPHVAYMNRINVYLQYCADTKEQGAYIIKGEKRPFLKILRVIMLKWLGGRKAGWHTALGGSTLWVWNTRK